MTSGLLFQPDGVSVKNHIQKFKRTTVEGCFTHFIQYRPIDNFALGGGGGGSKVGGKQ